MFVRWKRRERTERGKLIEKKSVGKKSATNNHRYSRRYESLRTGDWVKSAVVVESVRTPAGPRLKHVCYLGSIREAKIDDYYHQRDFWTSVKRNLDAARIVGKERRTIETALSAVVAKPDKKAEAKRAADYERKARELFQRLKKELDADL
jgi:hypothetical protein